MSLLNHTLLLYFSDGTALSRTEDSWVEVTIEVPWGTVQGNNQSMLLSPVFWFIINSQTLVIHTYICYLIHYLYTMIQHIWYRWCIHVCMYIHTLLIVNWHTLVSGDFCVWRCGHCTLSIDCKRTLKLSIILQEIFFNLIG